MGHARPRLRAAGESHGRSELLPAGRGRPWHLARGSTTPTTSSPTPGSRPWRRPGTTLHCARSYAEQGLAINSYSALLYGALSDAELQLGEYDAAFASIQTMVDLSPDTASLSRASYAWELRGDIDQARALMRACPRRCADACRPGLRARAPRRAGIRRGRRRRRPRTLHLDALDALPGDAAALAGKARAEAALGQIETALDDYAARRRPCPRTQLHHRVRPSARVGRPIRRGRRAVRRVRRHAAAVRRRTASIPTPRPRCSTPTGATSTEQSRMASRVSPLGRSSSCTTRTRGRCIAAGRDDEALDCDRSGARSWARAARCSTSTPA